VAFPTDILNTTLEDIEREVVEGLYETTPFMSWARKMGKVEKYSGGTYRRRVWEIADFANDTIIDDSYGFKEINLTMNAITDLVDFEHMRAIWPVAIGGKEFDENQGDEAIIKLADLRFRNAAAAFMRKWDRQLVAGDVTGYAQLGTINGSTNHGQSYGFLEQKAPASQDNVLGSGTNTFNKSTQYGNGVLAAANQYGTSSGTLAMKHLHELYAEMSTLAQVNGDGKIFHLGLMTPKCFTAYRNLLFEKERFVDAKGIDSQSTKPVALEFNGAPLVPHRRLPGQGTANAYSAVMLNLDSIRLDMHKDADFKWTGFKEAGAKVDGLVGHIKSMGVLTVGGSLATSAVLVNAEG
jgi:hypothetical protein